jgi:hypothetical protein
VARDTYALDAAYDAPQQDADSMHGSWMCEDLNATCPWVFGAGLHYFARSCAPTCYIDVPAP